MAQQQELSILEFKNTYGSEDACREHLFKNKWPKGFICEKCGCLIIQSNNRKKYCVVCWKEIREKQNREKALKYYHKNKTLPLRETL